MFAKTNLRQRILLGYLAPLLLMLIAMGIVFVKLQESKKQAELLDSAYSIVIGSKELNFSYGKLQRAVRGYMLKNDKETLHNFENAKKENAAVVDSLVHQVKDPQQLNNLHNLLEEGNKLVRQLQQMMDTVDAGKTDAAIATYRSEDETGQSNSLEKLGVEFEARETELLKQRQQAHDEAIATVVDSILYGLLSTVALAVAIAVWLARAISRNITENVSQISSAASEIAATVAQHERTASHQASAATEVSATIEELSASSRQSAEQAANAAGLTQQSGSATEAGGETVRGTVTAMNELRERIAAMAERIVQLGDQTSQIGGISALVKDLSGEINMLALNAAVEAARAGDHGKGFAVVASEVRKLADQSKKSAEQASQLVAEIQKATNATIMMTEEGTRTVSDVMQKAQGIAEVFVKLTDMAGRANENAQQVMLNAKQQSTAFNQVVTATNSIASGASETAAGLSQTKIGVQKLNEAAENLKAIA